MGSDLRVECPGMVEEGGDSSGRCFFICTFQSNRRYFIAICLASMAAFLLAACEGGNGNPTSPEGSKERTGSIRPQNSPQVPHHLSTTPLETLTIPRVDVEGGRFVAQASSGEPVVVRVGELIGKTKARVKAIYKERIMFEEPSLGDSGGTITTVVLNIGEDGKTSVFKARQIAPGQHDDTLIPANGHQKIDTFAQQPVQTPGRDR